MKHGRANLMWAYALDEKRRKDMREQFTENLREWIAEGLSKYGSELG